MFFHIVRWARSARRYMQSPQAKVAAIGFVMTAVTLAGSAAQRWK